uniref:dUTPase n=1 Tax=Siphoviridae sp. ctYh54 TaxID=2826379 RepID=A0A8S5ME78_9CAUD|nr:MAG TPA: dUTPase [Siphoviridae sp. ctYh54]
MDVEITPELLVKMYHKQYELQLYMKEKRGLTLPPAAESHSITHEHVLAAIYFSSCVNIEWMELYESYQAYLKAAELYALDADDLRAEALEELVDVWHFVLSVFIFLGLKEHHVSKLSHFKIGGVNSLAEYAGDTALAISSVLAKAPYKTWKDQDNIKELDKDYETLLFTAFSKCYNNILDFALFALDSSYSEFVDAYLRKNALNFRRQEDESLGYIRS